MDIRACGDIGSTRAPASRLARPSPYSIFMHVCSLITVGGRRPARRTAIPPVEMTTGVLDDADAPAAVNGTRSLAALRYLARAASSPSASSGVFPVWTGPRGLNVAECALEAGCAVEAGATCDFERLLHGCRDRVHNNRAPGMTATVASGPGFCVAASCAMLACASCAVMS